MQLVSAAAVPSSVLASRDGIPFSHLRCLNPLAPTAGVSTKPSIFTGLLVFISGNQPPEALIDCPRPTSHPLTVFRYPSRSLILPHQACYLFGNLAPRPGGELSISAPTASALLVISCHVFSPPLGPSKYSLFYSLTTIMEAPPPFFGYQIFAALDPLSSACNSKGAMTLPLHYRLVSSGDPSFHVL
ncbi:hypothetical protein BV22DRAFT_332925, partial [Leucogyrophana mollusca]